jgi:hypothetical protein
MATPTYGYTAPRGGPSSGPAPSAPTQRMTPSRTPAAPSPPPATGPVTPTVPQVGVPDLAGLYNQLVNAVKNQPLPANTSGLNQQAINMYNQNLAQMQAGYAQQLQQQQEMAAKYQQLASQQQMPIADFGELERQLRAEAYRRQPNRAVLVYGYQ